MANVCGFNMCVKGNRSDIEQFYNAMLQKGNIWMGRGAEAEISYKDENKAFITGWCKWSILSALIENAVSMRTEREKWGFGEDDPKDLEFITLFEACQKWNLVMEVYSEESGCEFQEHFVCDKGLIVCEECVDWFEYGIYEYETKEEAEEELGIEITDEEWNEGNDYITRGGFESWNFEI